MHQKLNVFQVVQNRISNGVINYGKFDRTIYNSVTQNNEV